MSSYLSLVSLQLADDRDQQKNVFLHDAINGQRSIIIYKIMAGKCFRLIPPPVSVAINLYEEVTIYSI